MRSCHRTIAVAGLIAILVAPACSGRVRTTKFVHPDFDFGFVEKVAVVPLENLSNDTQAGERATRILITELLASRAIDIVEPGELRAAMQRLSIATPTPSTRQVVELGKELGVQAVMTGSVTQSDLIRSGSVSIPVVTLDLHLLEVETAAPVWAATHTERGSTSGAKWLGTGAEPISETTRRCVRRSIRSLIKG